MIKFINALTGSTMWVADDRVDEYKAAGHKPAATDQKAEKPAEKKPVKKAKMK